MAVRRVIRRKKKFPTIGVILLMVGVVWLLMTLGKIVSFPWIPAVIIVIAIGLIWNRL